MVTLYTWLPAPASLVLGKGKIPDAGHSSLAVVCDDGAETYVSFWPEEDSLLGRIAALWKPRPTRHPARYADECDPMGAFLQRPADHADVLPGLDEERIVDGWANLQDSGYDLATWNCSNVTQCLLTLAIPAETYAALKTSGALTEDELAGLQDAADLPAALSFLTAPRVVPRNPLDVRNFALAYCDSVRNESASRLNRSG